MAKGLGKYQTKVAVIHIPKELKPLIEEEMDKIGAFTIVEAMSHILRDYFKDRLHLIAANPDEATIKEGENGQINGEESLLPYVRTR